MRKLLAALIVCGLPAAAGAQLYPAAPDWESSEVSDVGTGTALVDLDRDGWLDFVIANGNDMEFQRVKVYYNQGDGTLPTTADWQSSEQKYRGYVDVADVNGDGWPDVAVALLLPKGGPAARLYLNNSGMLSATPD